MDTVINLTGYLEEMYRMNAINASELCYIPSESQGIGFTRFGFSVSHRYGLPLNR